MSDGNRLRNYTLGFIVGLGLAGAVGHTFWADAAQLEKQASLQAQEHSAKYADPAYVAVECEASNVAATGQDQCIEAESEAAREAERSEYDLEAQQTMAIWTRVMGKAAIIGMGVGIIGLFLIFVTFWETRKAAVAGRDANRIAKSQQRARIIPFARWEAITMGESQVVVGCENIGLSPAINLRCAITVQAEVPKYPPLLKDWSNKRLVKAGAAIDLTYAKPKVLDAVLVGCIIYDTIYERNRKTFICMKFEWSNGSWHEIDCTPAMPSNT